ncbi:hypothetical protein I5G61_gp72 [Mycobacterium phage Quesadilla]|uniref:Uncharacterized protein n=1 Tax=Mycobacterium phage Quesadilla TaxID=2664226 RepID=A0A5Q2WD42_9CAUD|nr:hypothetical protein I5G61_gp72 [Mycobacterium phage Quesadilla]QGH75320.1 hypothetical protein SEA_QUESADILLA_72 [Mycobacterium phage Quesadilla]
MGRGGRRAMARNRARRKALGSIRVAGCLTPEKVRYERLSHAVHASARQLAEDGRLLTPYPCGRHYHLTSAS